MVSGRGCVFSDGDGSRVATTLGPSQVKGAVDQPDMAECLRVVPKVLSTSGGDLLGEEPQSPNSPYHGQKELLGFF